MILTMTREDGKCGPDSSGRGWERVWVYVECVHNWPDVNSYVWHFNECLLLFQHHTIFQMAKSYGLFSSTTTLATTAKQQTKRVWMLCSFHYFDSVRQRWTVIIFVFYGTACVWFFLPSRCLLLFWKCQFFARTQTHCSNSAVHAAKLHSLYGIQICIVIWLGSFVLLFPRLFDSEPPSFCKTHRFEVIVFHFIPCTFLDTATLTF